MLSSFLIGAAIGAITGIPIGPVNVAIIDAAYRQHLWRAMAVGFGGAVADMIYAAVGILGLGPILLSHPSVPPILYFVSGVVLVIYGILTVRAQPVDPQGTGGAQATRGWFWGGFLLGLALILLNPATLIAWVVIVGSHLSGGTHSEGIAAALGVGVGSAIWFSLVAQLADRGKKVLGPKVVWLTRIVGAALACYGLFSIGRAIHHVVTKL